jgi:hypothetical protein
MKSIGQERGLAKDGMLLGPVCPGIVRGSGNCKTIAGPTAGPLAARRSLFSSSRLGPVLGRTLHIRGQAGPSRSPRR